MQQKSPAELQTEVRNYYGKVLSHSSDLKTSACCSTESMPELHRQLMRELPSEVVDKFYGCGSPLPPALRDQTLLDIGCGSGRDAYLAAKLVGPRGRVLGLDMTEEQLQVARKHLGSEMARYGYAEPNLSFHDGLAEDLLAAGVEDSSCDLVISNCVINLSPDKPRVLREIFRVLKPGGELYFSDVFSDRRIPENVKTDPVLYGECLGGALYPEDFRRLLAELGCPDPRTVSSRPIEIVDPKLQQKLGAIRFFSVTVRAFKLENLEDRCEDYGQLATYKGGLPECAGTFILDDHHRFEEGRPERVCGNTAAMLEQTRYRQYFELHGDRARHFGLFDCARPPGEGPPGACG